MSKRLIYAEDAIDAICKACSIVGDYHKCDGYPETSTWCDELVALRALPSAQPEVVYCKKCRHWTRTCGDEQWGLGDCDVFDKHLVMCNGYCAWAERKENE